MGVFKDLTGQKIERLTVIGRSKDHESPSGRLYIMWDCICECGTKTRVRTSALTSVKARIVSCGCYSAESTSKRSTKHGMSNSREYHTYRSMIARCNNKENPAYHSYGGRGIRVCDRWMESFEKFYDDMGDRPKDKTLDRIDNDGDYCKENCKWSTRSEQSINRRKTGGTSSYRGVSYSKMYKCFVAQIYYKGFRKKIGNFKKEIEAAIAFDKYVFDNDFPHKTNGLYDHQKQNREKEGGKKF